MELNTQIRQQAEGKWAKKSQSNRITIKGQNLNGSSHPSLETLTAFYKQCQATEKLIHLTLNRMQSKVYAVEFEQTADLSTNGLQSVQKACQ